MQKRSAYESGKVEIFDEIRAVCTHSCNMNFDKRNATDIYNARCRRTSAGSFQTSWPFKNSVVPRLDIIETNGLRFAILVYSTIEHMVCSRHKDSPGPMKLLLGMSFIMGAKNKLNYIMNRLGILPSYETIDAIRKRLTKENGFT